MQDVYVGAVPGSGDSQTQKLYLLESRSSATIVSDNSDEARTTKASSLCENTKETPCCRKPFKNSLETEFGEIGDQSDNNYNG